MKKVFTSYEDAMTAVHMVQLFALNHGCRMPQYTIAYFEERYHVTEDTVELPK